MINKIKTCAFTDGLLLAALVLVGGFHEYISCALSVAMCLYLLLRMGKSGKLLIAKDIWTSVAVAISFGYGLTCFWAVDKGMAFVGFCKFMPLLLYLICLRQEQRTDTVLELLPWLAVVMAAISAIGMQIPLLESLFSVADRLAGFFQYPNTFAVFLLVCQLMVLKKESKQLWDYVLMALLVAALLYTGSRTALVVALLANFGMVLTMAGKKTRLILLAVIAGVCLTVGLLALNENSVLHRYLNISLTQSTFVGRLLYWVDALPLLLRYPLGMGYMGYFYIQGSIQTGVYSVAYAHNDFLQLLLDVGFVPAGLLIGALIAWFCRKTIPAADKIIVGAICLHSFFDFDLQYAGMFLLLLLLVSRHEQKPDLRLKVKLPLKALIVTAMAISVYMGCALALAHWGAYRVADTLYPFNTQNKLVMLEQEEDLTRAEELADQILRQNTAYFAPYTVKASCCYNRGDIEALIQYKRAVFDRNPFEQKEYENYCRMLMNAAELYKKAGDSQSVKTCVTEMSNAQKQLESNRNRLSKLGSMIQDQPNMVLPEDIRSFINQNGGGSK